MTDAEKYRKFAALVQKMREAQQQYFKLIKAKDYAQAGGWLKTSKALEKLVDTATAEILSGVEVQKLF